MTSFFIYDLPLLLFLLFIEIIFSADNFLAISSLATRLGVEKRSKALWIGFISGLVLRTLAIVFLTFLIKHPGIQLLGAAYLIFMGSKELAFPNSPHINKPRSFWKTVFYIEITDVLFAIDSILAAFAILTSRAGVSKIWMIYVSSLLGMFIMRFAASKLSSLLAKLPNMLNASHALIIWIGFKFIVEALPYYFSSPTIAIFTQYYSFIFWIGSVIILLYGCKSQKKPL